MRQRAKRIAAILTVASSRSMFVRWPRANAARQSEFGSFILRPLQPTIKACVPAPSHSSGAKRGYPIEKLCRSTELSCLRVKRIYFFCQVLLGISRFRGVENRMNSRRQHVERACDSHKRRPHSRGEWIRRDLLEIAKFSDEFIVTRALE